MQDLKILLVQADQKWEDKRANFDNYDRLLTDHSGMDLIILPEMFHTGFSMNAEILAETYENSVGLDWLRKTAKDKNSAIYTSLIFKETNCFYNRGVFVYPNGELKTYDKRKCFGLAGEDRVFQSGQQKTIVEYKDWKIQLQICYDLRFPEISRNSISSNLSPEYDVLLYVANWPEKRNLHWESLLVARAIENQSYVIGVNRVGEDGKKLNYSGNSMFVDALGNKECIKPYNEEVMKVVLSKNTLQQIRTDLPFLKD